MDLESECKHIFNMLRNYKHTTLTFTNTCVFTRLLFMTSKCDGMKEGQYFSNLRHSFQNMIGDESLKKIVSYDENMIDMKKAYQAVFHHRGLL